MHIFIKQIFTVILLTLVGLDVALAQDAYYVWSEFEQGNIQVFLGASRTSNEHQLIKLSNSGINISPAIIASNSTVWSAWVDRQNTEHYQLNYVALNRSDDRVVEQGFIATTDATVYSPSFARNDGGKLWLVWSGFDGEDEEIRAAFWRPQVGWSTEIAITDNNVPDTLPSIKFAANGDLDITWEQLASTGFVTKQKTLSNDAHALTRSNHDATVSALSFRRIANVAGRSSRKSKEASLNFTQQAHPEFIRKHHSNILMGSSHYLE